MQSETKITDQSGDVSGAGSAIVGGSAVLTFGAASNQQVSFADGGDGTLKLDMASMFSGSVSGFGAGDKLDLGGIAFGTGTQLTYQAHDSGLGGMLGNAPFSQQTIILDVKNGRFGVVKE